MNPEENELKTVRIRCPQCKKNGSIKVNPNITERADKGVVAVNIAEGVLCEHSMIAYIDRHYMVRDSFICDFSIKIPDLEINLGDSDKDLEDIVSTLYHIKMYLLPSDLIGILDAMFSNKKRIYIVENEFLISLFNRFLEYIMKDSFNSRIEIISRKNYQKAKKDYKKRLVINSDNGGKYKRSSNKSNSIERIIVGRFYDENDPKVCLIVLKNEILKAFRMAGQILKFSKAHKPVEINSIVLGNELKKAFGMNVGSNYLIFLTHIVNSYHLKNLEYKIRLITNFSQII